MTRFPSRMIPDAGTFVTLITQQSKLEDLTLGWVKAPLLHALQQFTTVPWRQTSKTLRCQGRISGEGSMEGFAILLRGCSQLDACQFNCDYLYHLDGELPSTTTALHNLMLGPAEDSNRRPPMLLKYLAIDAPEDEDHKLTECVDFTRLRSFVIHSTGKKYWGGWRTANLEPLTNFFWGLDPYHWSIFRLRQDFKVTLWRHFSPLSRACGS